MKTKWVFNQCWKYGILSKHRGAYLTNDKIEFRFDLTQWMIGIAWTPGFIQVEIGPFEIAWWFKK